MILAIDIGNTQVAGGVFDGDKLIFQFRKATASGTSSDEIGLFLKLVLRENGIEPQSIDGIACCSVVPAMNYATVSACKKYFSIEPLMIQAGIKTGLKLRLGNAKEVGADLIAGAMGALQIASGKDIVVVDMGTATTLVAINKDGEYLGGVIMPGLSMSMQALANGTAQLPSVAIAAPVRVCGTSTVDAIQSGLYYGALGGIKELILRFSETVFEGRKAYVIGTGGMSRLFEKEGLFDDLSPSLVLDGLLYAYKINRKGE